MCGSIPSQILLTEVKHNFSTVFRGYLVIVRYRLLLLQQIFRKWSGRFVFVLVSLIWTLQAIDMIIWAALEWTLHFQVCRGHIISLPCLWWWILGRGFCVLSQCGDEQTSQTKWVYFTNKAKYKRNWLEDNKHLMSISNLHFRLLWWILLITGKSRTASSFPAGNLQTQPDLSRHHPVEHFLGKAFPKAH